MDYRIDNTFELLSQEEWDKHLESPLFEGMVIDPSIFPVAQDHVSQMVYNLGFRYSIRQHNNKVGTLKVSYALCRHYFDKGIPDNPWYISPGKAGQSVQYMPEFQAEDWMKRYWFAYFSETVYFKLFSIWDSIVGLINEYYQMGYAEDLRFKQNVMKSLKSQRNDIAQFMSGILDEKIYKDANTYRTKIVHGSTPLDVSSGICIKRNTEAEFVDWNEDGTPRLTEDGKVIIKKSMASTQISYGIGDYTETNIMMENIDAFIEFTGERIKQIIDLFKTDTFHIRV